MLLSKINLNHLRIFETVYRLKSMTLAAQELHLTQSGISQHMKALEDALSVILFDRIKKRLVPTSAATTLFQKCTESFDRIEGALKQIQGLDRELQGTVSVGMPIEFGNSLVLPLLQKFSAKHPQVQFQLRLDFASAMNDLLIRGELDFAFIDDFAVDHRIKTESVYDEVLDLCIHPDLMTSVGGVASNTKKYFERLPYVDYQKDAPVLRMWFGHHLGAKNLELNLKTSVMDVQAIARLVSLGMGAGVLPHHVVAKMNESGGQPLYVFRGCGRPLLNTIRIAHLSERSQTPAAEELIRFLTDGLKALKLKAGSSNLSS